MLAVPAPCCLAGSLLGFLFAIITLKLSLGSAGIIPGLGIPAALIAFALLKCWTSISTSLGLEQKVPWLHNLLFKPFLVQENSVMQVRVQRKQQQVVQRQLVQPQQHATASEAVTVGAAAAGAAADGAAAGTEVL